MTNGIVISSFYIILSTLLRPISTHSYNTHIYITDTITHTQSGGRLPTHAGGRANL